MIETVFPVAIVLDHFPRLRAARIDGTDMGVFGVDVWIYHNRRRIDKGIVGVRTRDAQRGRF